MGTAAKYTGISLTGGAGNSEVDFKLMTEIAGLPEPIFPNSTRPYDLSQREHKIEALLKDNPSERALDQSLLQVYAKLGQSSAPDILHSSEAAALGRVAGYLKAAGADPNRVIAETAKPQAQSTPGHIEWQPGRLVTDEQARKDTAEIRPLTNLLAPRMDETSPDAKLFNKSRTDLLQTMVGEWNKNPAQVAGTVEKLEKAGVTFSPAVQDGKLYHGTTSDVLVERVEGGIVATVFGRGIGEGKTPLASTLKEIEHPSNHAMNIKQGKPALFTPA